MSPNNELPFRLLGGSDKLLFYKSVHLPTLPLQVLVSIQGTYTSLTSHNTNALMSDFGD